jgi:8-oxo-dGTP pyrophosphatase MutT (NUDIX family)
MVAADAWIWGHILTPTRGAAMGDILDKTALRDAATVIVLRDRATRPCVLMGQRGASAAFMPNKYVFPGGAVDAGDGAIKLARGLSQIDADRLTEHSTRTPETLAAAAIRELWEETGQILGTPKRWPDAPQGWRGFARSGHRPNASALQFVFRAVTPQGRPRGLMRGFLWLTQISLSPTPTISQTPRMSWATFTGSR